MVIASMCVKVCDCTVCVMSTVCVCVNVCVCVSVAVVCLYVQWCNVCNRLLSMVV